MAEGSNLYENLVVEEDELVQKVTLCETYQWTILDSISKQGEIGKEIGEELLTVVHTIEHDLRTELLHLRIEKGLLAAKLDKEKDIAKLFDQKKSQH